MFQMFEQEIKAQDFQLDEDEFCRFAAKHTYQMTGYVETFVRT